jgi:hypothetical protein
VKLAAYEIIENSPTRFSIKYSRSLQAWLLSPAAMAVGLFLFLLLNGFDPLNVIGCLIVFPVCIILMVLVYGQIPFSIFVDPNRIVIVRKWLAKFPRESSIERSSISALTAEVRRLGRFSIFYRGSIEAITQGQKQVVIYSVSHSGRDAIVKEIQFVAGELSRILSLPVNMDTIT